MTRVATFLFALAALGIAVIALVVSSQATIGTSLMGFACLLGIFARMAQASAHREEKRTIPTQTRSIQMIE